MHLLDKSPDEEREVCINRQLGNRFGKSRTGPGPAISLMSHSSSPPILRVHFGARRFPFGGRVSWSTSAIISLGLHCCFFFVFFYEPPIHSCCSVTALQSDSHWPGLGSPHKVSWHGKFAPSYSHQRQPNERSLL